MRTAAGGSRLFCVTLLFVGAEPIGFLLRLRHRFCEMLLAVE